MRTARSSASTASLPPLQLRAYTMLRPPPPRRRSRTPSRRPVRDPGGRRGRRGGLPALAGRDVDRLDFDLGQIDFRRLDHRLHDPPARLPYFLPEALRDVEVQEHDALIAVDSQAARKLDLQTARRVAGHVQLEFARCVEVRRDVLVALRYVEPRLAVLALDLDVATRDDDPYLRVRARRDDDLLGERQDIILEREQIRRHFLVQQDDFAAVALQIDLGDRDDRSMDVARRIREQKRDPTTPASIQRRVAVTRDQRQEESQHER